MNPQFPQFPQQFFQGHQITNGLQFQLQSQAFLSEAPQVHIQIPQPRPNLVLQLAQKFYGDQQVPALPHQTTVLNHNLQVPSPSYFNNNHTSNMMINPLYGYCIQQPHQIFETWQPSQQFVISLKSEIQNNQQIGYKPSVQNQTIAPTLHQQANYLMKRESPQPSNSNSFQGEKVFEESCSRSQVKEDASASSPQLKLLQYEGLERNIDHSILSFEDGKLKINVSSVKIEMAQKKKQVKQELEEQINIKKSQLLLDLGNKQPQMESAKTPIRINQQMNKRSSKYSGVSKNGRSWQVQIIGMQTKRYLCCLSDEDDAAKVYDYYSILNRGLKARTNFKYSNDQLSKISKHFTSNDVLQSRNLNVQRKILNLMNSILDEE